MILCDPILNRNVLGVFPADGLPSRNPNYPHGFIANTDIHSRPDQHWCAFHDDGSVVIYCRTVFIFVRWLDTNAKTIDINEIQLHTGHTTLCGFYCMLFLRERPRLYHAKHFEWI